MRDSTSMIYIEIKFILSVTFFVDIVLNLNTGYYNKGKIIEDRQMILNNYLKKSFLSDLTV